MRWNVLQANGKSLLVYFRQNGAQEPVLLTPQGLAAGTAQYIIVDQSLAMSCGNFEVTQLSSNPTLETSPSPQAVLPPSGPSGAERDPPGLR